MSEPHWPRAQWRDSGEEAFLLWFVFGDFDTDLRIDGDQYRTRGLPAGIEAVRYRNDALAKWDGYPLAGTLGRVLWDENPRLFERAKSAGECYMLRGALRDPSDLDALRDLVGTIEALCNAGGIAVVDPQTLSMFSVEEWHARFFAADTFAARDHVLILCDDDEQNAGRLRVHTRGLRKFARPDIDIRNVPSALSAHAGGLAQTFVEYECDGGLVDDGHAVGVEGAPQQLVVRITGSSSDDDFNNRHLALRWPD
jgi:hypothetical protein